MLVLHTSKEIVSDISDHFSQFCVCRSLGRKIKPRKIVSRDTSKFSEEKFVNDLSQLHWESILSTNPSLFFITNLTGL